MKLFFLILFLVTSAHSQVIKNKGPIFTINHTIQKDLLVDYALFRTENFLRDKLKAESLEISYLKQLLLNDNFRLPSKPKLKFEEKMQVISNRIASSYKDPKTNEYISPNFLYVEYGLCMGYTVTMRQFHYFGFFDTTKVPVYDKKKNFKEWSAYYRKLIDNVFASKPTIIPGFKSLYELSQSEVGDYLQRHIADQWALKNSNLEGAINWAMPLPRLTKGSVAKIKGKIDNFLNRNFEPLIIFYDNSSFSSYAHVQRAISTSEQNEKGCFKLKTLDIDGGINVNTICPGRDEWRIEIAPNETLEFTDYYLNLNKGRD